MYKPERYELDKNLKQIETYVNYIKTLKSLYRLGSLPQRVYHTNKHYLSIVMNNLHEERKVLLERYKKALSAYHEYKRKEVLISNEKQKEIAKGIIESLTQEEKKALKSFWHLV